VCKGFVDVYIDMSLALDWHRMSGAREVLQKSADLLKSGMGARDLYYYRILLLHLLETRTTGRPE